MQGGHFDSPDLGAFDITLEFSQEGIPIQNTADEAAYTAWAAVRAFDEYGPQFSLRAMASCVNNTVIRVGDEETVRHDCNAYGGPINGCMFEFEGQRYIYLVNERGYSCENAQPTIGHEFLHLIAQCMGESSWDNSAHSIPGLFANNPNDEEEGWNEETAENRLVFHPSNFCGAIDPSGLKTVEFD